jgi:hypothetical protein
LRPISLMTKHLAQAALRSIDKACKIVANAADQVDDPAENACAKAVAAKMKRSARSPATSATTWARPAGKDSVMSHTKEAVQRKRRSKAVPVLGATGLSLSLASGACAATGVPPTAASCGMLTRKASTAPSIVPRVAAAQWTAQAALMVICEAIGAAWEFFPAAGVPAC